MLSFSAGDHHVDSTFYDGLETEHMQDEVPFTSTISLKDQKAANGSAPAPPPPPRQRVYFIIRSNSMCNLQISQREGAWCSQRFNEPKLDEAFSRRGSEVRLLFSATGTYAFQGWATMTTKIAQLGRVVLWEFGKTYGPPFGCHWKNIFTLSEQDPVISGLTNPWNGNLPVLNSGDGQEIPMDIGDLIVQRMEQRAAAEGIAPPPAPPPPVPFSQRFSGPRPPPFGGRGGFGGGPPPYGQMGGRGRGPVIEERGREEKSELLDMSYEEYLTVYERVRLKMKEIKESKQAAVAVKQIQPQFQPQPQHAIGVPEGMVAGMGAPAGSVGARPYSEDEYVSVTLAHFHKMGKPPPTEIYIRSHYRQSLAGVMR